MNTNRLVEISREIVKGKELRHRHVAFILRGSHIIEIGWNKAKTHPRTMKYSYSNEPEFTQLHAELDAVIKGGRDNYSSYTLVVIRIRKGGKLGLSKPCPGCQDMINQLGFKEVWYSTNFQNFELLGG